MVFGIHLLWDIKRFLKLESNNKSSIRLYYNVLTVLLIEKELTFSMLTIPIIRELLAFPRNNTSVIFPFDISVA